MTEQEEMSHRKVLEDLLDDLVVELKDCRWSLETLQEELKVYEAANNTSYTARILRRSQSLQRSVTQTERLIKALQAAIEKFPEKEKA